MRSGTSWTGRTQISIHALREEGDRGSSARCIPKRRFLSTPSARRATPNRSHEEHPQGNFYPRPPRGGRPPDMSLWMPLSYFYPRPPRGGRRSWGCTHSGCRTISIHALREEGDPTAGTGEMECANFYPRPPRGGRLQQVQHSPYHPEHFYPRPPRGGRRCKFFRPRRRSSYFYPRPPRGGRPKRDKTMYNRMQFLSTPSARRAT